jgi:hypothetical protein
MALSPRYQEILARIPHLPSSAKVPVAVAAAHEGVSVKTILRRFPLVAITEHRKGVTVAYLRRHQRAELSAA